MKILDWYILKRYLFTFLMMLLLFIPIAIMVHLAEKIGKIISNDVPLDELAMYLLNFTIYFANLLFPLFLFLSVIFFTSKLARNTEVVAFLSSGVSFTRFLRPYIIGAIIVAIMALFLGMFLAPKLVKVSMNLNTNIYPEIRIYKTLKMFLEELQTMILYM